jgi:fibronectin type 3 domain-containing protein
VTRRQYALPSRARTPFRAAVIALLTAALVAPQLALPTVAGAAEPATPVSAKVVFQSAAGLVPDATWTKDTGAAYTDAAGRGWITQASLGSATHVPFDITKNTRYRATSSSCTGTFTNLQRSIIHMQAPGTANTATLDITPVAWEYDVPNGTYQVGVGIGDLSYGGDAEFHTIHVEGVTAFNRYPRKTSSAPAANSCGTTGQNSTTVWTTVTDGKLTIDAVGGQNTKLDYVTIDSVPIADLTATAGETSIALDWSDLAYATGYRVWRSTTLPVIMTGTPLAAPTESAFTDSSAAKGQVYYYAVAPATGTTASVVGGLIDDASAAAPSWPVKVNFEGGANSTGGVRSGITTPTGWTSDSGLNYANVRGFGWVDETGTPVDLTKNGRFRANETAYSPTLTSTMHMQGNTVNAFGGTQVQGTWQLKVPNGSYDVALGVGDADPGSDPTAHTVNVEGVNVINAFVPGATGAARFKEETKTVEVTDGFLTVDAIGGVNTKIDYITVTPTPADQPPAKPSTPVATAGNNSVALDWDDNGDDDLKGYNVFRGTSTTVPTTGTPLNGATPLTGSSYLDDSAVNGTAYYYVVVAVDNADQASQASAAAGPVTPQPTEPALVDLPLKINFTSADAPAIPGYTQDHGLPFTNAVGRGWVEPGTHNPRNLVDNSRLRAVRAGVTQTDQQRGLVHMESADITASFTGTKTTGSYEVAVPTGYYDVTVSAGDQPGSATATCLAPCYDSQHTIKVEGDSAIDAFQATATKEFAEKTVERVHVTDGRLTIDSGGADSFNTKINYLEIVESDVTAPGIPANVEATAGDGTVELSWDAVDATDLKGYLVYRANDEDVALDEANLLTPTAITETSFTDATVVNKTAYHYVVIAIDNTGNTSAASETVGATPADTTAPAVPTLGTLTPGNASVTVRWTAGDTAADFDHFRLYRSTTSPLLKSAGTFIASPSAAEFVDQGDAENPLVNDTQYFYAVSAVDNEGNESELSAEKSATPTLQADVTAPMPPTELTAVPGDNKVTLHWTAGEDSDIAGYQVWRAATATDEPAMIATGIAADATSYVDPTALNGNRYYYALTATDFAGNQSGRSAQADAAPVDTVAPAAPTGVVATAGIQRITVSWAANTETDVVRFRIYRFSTATPEINDAHLVAILTTATGRTFVDSDRTPGTTYHYAVVAVDGAGNASDASDVVSATALDTPDTTAPGEPAGLAATVVDGAVTLSWNAVTAGDLAGYTVYRSATAGGAKVKVSSMLVTGTTFTDAGAPAGATAYYVVTAADTAGNESGASNQVSAEIPAAGLDVKFVFAPTTAAAITGYTKETGAAFDATRGYGWVTQASLSSATHTPLDLSANTRLRTRAAVTDLQNRLIHMQYGDIVPTPTANGSLTAGAWEYLVPNGRYTVTAGVGDQPGGAKTGCADPCYDSLHTVRAEGTTLIDKFQATAAAEYKTGAATVDVTDGRLTVDAIGGTNTKMDWLTIVGAGPIAPDTTAPAAPSSLLGLAGDTVATLSWAAPADPDVVGYNVYRSTGATVEVGAATKINDSLVAGSSFADSGLTNGTTYRYVVTAVDSSSNESVASASTTVTPAAGAGGTVSLKVNFADAATAPPAGYVADYGQAFGVRAGANQGTGNAYGWVKTGSSTPVSIDGNGRNRNTGTPAANQPDLRLATFIHMQLPANATAGVHEEASWELAVPNGAYQVTVAVGDAGTAVDSSNWINIENQNAIAAFVPSTDKFATATRTVTVSDGRLTLSPTAGTNTKIDYVDVVSVDRTNRPYVTDVHPGNLATNVVDNTSVTTDNFLLGNLETAGAVDPATLGGGNVSLVNVVTGAPVPGTGVTSGGGDTVTFQASEPLEGGVLYRFSVTSAVTDLSGRAFLPFSSVFTTANGSGGGGDLSGVAFDKSDSGATVGKSYTSLVIGPDGKLYAGSIYGYIYRWTINADGTLANQETFDTVRTHASAKGWEGAPNRTVIGMAFDPASTSTNPILWITDNYAYLGSDVPDFTGSISRLTGPNLENYQEVVVNLPRSIKDHETNSIAFKDGKLLIVQGSMNAMGGLDGTWRRNEHLLSAAMLQLDPAKLPATLPVDVATPDMSVPVRGSVAAHVGSYNPYATDAPLTLYATGIRNAFDLLVHSNGRVYAGTNGSAAGGATPATPTPLPAACSTRPDGGTTPTAPGIANNQQAETDYLFDIKQGKYYGHPNPLRCQYVLNAGNPVGYTGNALFKVNAYPAGQAADPNYDLAGVHDAGLHASANGTIEYKNSVAFGGALAGKVIVVRYSSNQEIVAFNVTAGGSVSAPITGITGFTGFKQPLDVAQDVTTGNLYVSELTDNPATTGIKLLKPQGGGSAPKAEATSRLVFTDVANTTASAPKSASVKNIGGLPLVISGAGVTGINPSVFVRTGTFPITVAPGATATIPVTFNPSVPGVNKANLVLATNDPTTPTTTIALRGLGTKGTGGSNEPSLQWILDTLDIKVNVGDPDPTDNVMPDTDELLGDEVDMPSFTKLLFDRKVGIAPLSLFGPDGPAGNTNVAVVAAHRSTDPTDRVVLFNGPNSSNQAVLPDVTTVGEWDLDDAFGFDVTWPGLSNRVTWSEDAKNAAWVGANSSHKVRVYPLKDAAGTVVEGSFIVAPEDVPSGVDFQDAVFVVSNVKVPATAGAGKLTATPKELVFSGPRGTTSATQQVTLTNNGITPLLLSNLTVDGTDAASFALAGVPTLPATVPVGESITVGVQFKPGAASTVGAQSAALKITSDDPTAPTLSYGLYGLATTGEQGNNEPTLKAVVDTLGYPINVGGTGLVLGTNPTPIGDEVGAPLFTKAGSAPVTMTPVARYSPDELLPFGWYLPNAGDPVTNELATIALDNEQTLNPKTVAGGTDSFDPGAAPFGFFVDSKSFGRKTYTQDGLNTNIPHGVRTYPVKNRAGVLVPNTYLVTFEDAQNGDYQDYVFLVTGVTPTGGVTTGTPVARIDFQPATSAVAADYTADTGAAYTAARGYGWVVPGTGTPLDMTAMTRDRAGTAEAKLRTVILMQPTATQSPNGPGAWEYTVPNGSYVVTVGVGDSGFTDSTHRVQVEGQTVITGFAPTTANPFSTATATVTVSDGSLTVDATGGTNTKLTFVDIDKAPTGTDTTAPSVTATLSGLQSTAGVYKNKATVTVTASDVGTGVAGISYSLDNGSFTPYTAPVEVTTTGAHTVRARAQDAAGNVTTTAVTNFSVVSAGLSQAAITVENADGAPFADRLVMNRIQNPETGTTCKAALVDGVCTAGFITANVVHDTGTLVVRNTGTEALNVTDLAVTGPFNLVNPPTLPALVPAGGSISVQVRFNATTIGTSGGLWSGTLTVSSDDVTHPTVPVELAGFWQSVSEGGQEPDVAELAKLFGYTSAITAAGVALNQHGLVHASGDEVLSPYWLRADSSQPVTVRQLAAFHTQGNTATFFWHAKGSNSTTSLITHAGAEGQSILPHRNGSTTVTASGTFAPSTAFGIKIDPEWSDPSKNDGSVDIAAGCTGPCGHHVRAWAVRDRSGAIVPNTWLVGMDYSGINYDYNDNLYLVGNMKPETAADPAAAALLPGAAALQLPFTSAVTGTLADATGQGTGFTGTQPNKLDLTVGVNSYDPSKLHLTTAGTGTLAVDSSATGTDGATGTNGSNDNTLVNGLQLPFDASGGTFTVSARAMGPLDQLNAGSEQQGIMIGADQDNYVKVAAINKSGVPSIEFYSEIGGTGATNGVTVAIPSPATLNTLDLVLIGDPSAGTVRAAYRLGGGAWIPMAATYQVPTAALGKIFGARQFAGILVSHKAGAAFTATYDSFGVSSGDGTEAAAARDALYRFDVAGSGNYTDAQGRLWTPDTGRFSPATAVEEGASATQEIAGTDDDVLYRTYRGNVGNVSQAQRVLSYDLPAKGATKVDVRLHFAERAAGNNAVGKRLFDIGVEGTPVRSNFDIFAAAGGVNTATVLSVNNVTVTGGQLNLTFKASVDYPSIAAIEVLCQGTCPTPDTTAPDAPTGLVGTAGDTGIALDWADSPATDLMGYNVYRSASENGTYTKLNSSPLAGSSYLDATAGSGAQVFYRVKAIDSSENESASSATVAVTPPLPPTVRINAGGPAQSVSGTTWSACSALTACSGWVTGGNEYNETDTITGIPAGANNAIFQSEWTGGGSTAVGAKIFGFAVPVNNGYYRVRLHFAELNKTAAGTRLFDVRLENTTVLSNFDVWVQAGGIDKAVVREFPVRITDGVVNIDFLKRVENAKISAIEIIPTDGPDTAAPAPVTGVTATASTSGITVAFSASTAADLVGYNVYRATSAGGTYAKVNAALLTGTSFSDPTAPQGAASYYQVTAVDNSGNESVRSATVNATRPSTARPTIRINAGGSGLTVGTTAWTGCSSPAACSGRVTGGNAYSESDTITGIPTGLNNSIFQSEWTGGQAGGGAIGARAFLFTVPVTNGYYRVRLHFAELNKTAAGTRLFDVKLENTTVLSNFDIWSAAGGIDRAIVREFTANVADGAVSIDFITRRENAKISAIEIIPVDGPDTTAPSAVTGLTATGSATAVALSWSASTAADLTGYNVYRASSATGSYSKLNSAPVTGRSYSDTTIAAGGTGYYQVTAVDNSGNESARSATAGAARVRPTIRINAGGPAQTVGTTTWSSCSSLTACSNWVTSGFTHTETDTITGIPAGLSTTILRSEWTGGRAQPAPVAVGARAFGFSVPVTNGAYRVRLHFVELNKTAANTRLFDVRLEGSTVLSNYDIWAQAGGIDRAIVEEFPVTISDGVVTIDFITRRENAKVSAIEIIPTTGTDTAAPAALSAVTAAATPTAITLKAAASPVPDVKGYNVYRATSAAATPVRVNSKPLALATYTDRAPAPGVTAYYQMTAVDRSGNESKRSTRVAAARQATVRINAGGTAQKVGAVRWSACPSARACGSTTIVGGGARAEADRISGLAAGTNTSLYRSEWYGGAGARVGTRAFAVSVPVAKGTYRVRLHFVELAAVKPGARRFDVRLEGRTVLSNLDIVRTARGVDRAVVRELRTPVVDGKRSREFIKRAGAAKISAIEIIPVG